VEPVRPPAAIKLEGDAERVRIDHARILSALVAQVGDLTVQVVSDVSLAPNIATVVPHKLGRKPLWFGPSLVRNQVTTGRIEDSGSSFNNATVDTTLVKVVKAVGFGATVIVDFLVVG
jgi:hypothetical protein